MFCVNLMAPRMFPEIIFFRLLFFLPVLLCQANGFPERTTTTRLSRTLTAFQSIYYPHSETINKYLQLFIDDSELNLTQPCVQSLMKLKDGLQSNQLWAMRFLDASGRGTGGLLSYYVIDLGNYDACLSLDVEAINGDPLSPSFKGQYCLAKIHSPAISKTSLLESNLNGTLLEFFRVSTSELELSPPQIGICLPSTCPSSQITQAINKYSLEYGLQIELGPFCDTQETYQQPYSGIEKVSITGMAVFTILTVVGTLYEKSWLRHFSAIRNFNRLIRETSNSEKQALSFINGGKVYYLVLTIWGHIWYIMGTLIPPLYMGVFSYTISENKILQELSANCLLFIEMIIFVGGVLTMYTCYQVLEKTRGKLPFIQYMVVRYLRTTPTVIATILLTFLWPRLGSGPFFRELAYKQTKNCIKHWWRNLLYINNYQHVLDMCVPSTWYLSSDFQLYAVSYLPIILLYRKPRLGLAVSFVYIFGSAGYMMYDAWRRNLKPLIDMRSISASSINGISDLYLPFHLHIQSYIIGVLSGYFIALKKKPEIKGFFTIGWIVCVPLGLSTLYFTYAIKFFPNVTRFEQLLFIGFHRILVVIAFAWAAYAFSFGSGGWFKQFFEWKFFAPISSMSLSIVLVQFVFMFYDLGSKRQPLVFTHYNQLIYGITSLVMCILLGAVLHIIVEAPTANLLASSMRLRKIKLPVVKISPTTNNNIGESQATGTKEEANNHMKKD